ncbi:hypothetical protein SAMN04487907_101222 [Zunongwangia mangrovi]|uniref:Cytochrome C and Quinol oxidase polypeptide I n=1 Tax=Zunongwangia mangrovi TaxID=1334022 RepID=A0A1I1D9J3_9FLAO|nr:hypothetical protein [Zunongwangia mangrovi]SFB71487.1 hypothetical protein SAMN04487907_101222 [Zunongwangia mangrovi]
MKFFLTKSYKLFWVLIPLVFMYGLFNKEHSLMVNIHATYFVINHLDFAGLIVIFFGLFGLAYWLMDIFNKKLISWMTAYHVFISIFGLLILLVFYDEVENLEIDYAFKQTLILLMLITAGVTVAVQLLFPINLIVSFLRKKKH